MSLIDRARPILIDVLKREEGLRLAPYQCSAGVWTIGVGATRYPDGRPVRQSDPPITEDRAMRMLAAECVRYLMDTADLCERHTTAVELAALASLAYNVGIGALSRSTVLRLHNAGDRSGAARAFGLWNKARVNGVLTPLRGLTARRAREAALYLTQDPAAQPEPSAQAVAPESSLVASPMMQSGGAVVAVGGVSALSLVGDAMPVIGEAQEHARQAAEWLGVSPMAALAFVLLLAGGAVMYWRHRQRAGGWA